MEKLKSLVKAQKDAWEEQQKALEGVQDSESADKSEDFIGKQKEDAVLQQVSLSFSTLSTRYVACTTYWWKNIVGNTSLNIFQ